MENTLGECILYSIAAVAYAYAFVEQCTNIFFE